MSELWNSVRSMAVGVFATYPYSIFSWSAAAGVSLILLKRYFGGGVCCSKARLDGKTAIITGANTGIGLETAVDFAQRNGRVILACRNQAKGEAAVEQVKKRSGNNNVVFMKLDLASLESVRDFCARVLDSEARIDILVNNAGIMACPPMKTVDGFEMQFGVNHLAHFLLTNLLLSRLKQAPSARIVNVSSLGHNFGKIHFDDINLTKNYSPWTAYFQSKLANVLFTRSLAKRLEGTNVCTTSVHPGGVRTELGRHMNFILYFIIISTAWVTHKSPWQGAQTSIYCAVSEEMEGVSGPYMADCKVAKSRNPLATDDAVGERLWEVSSEMVHYLETRFDMQDKSVQMHKFC